MSLGTRHLLILSLGAVLLLTALTGCGALLVLERIRTGETELRTRVLERRESLRTNPRRKIHPLQAPWPATHFAEPDGSDALTLLTRLNKLEAVTNAALLRYSQAMPRQSFEASQLHGEVVTYWKVLDLMEDMARKRRTPALDAHFQRQLAQRRETMLQIAADIDRAIAHELQQGDEHHRDVYAPSLRPR